MAETNKQTNRSIVIGGKLSKIIRTFLESDLLSHGHLKVICKKAPQILSITARLANVISEHKRKVLTKNFLNLNLDIVHYYGCFQTKT